MPNVVVTGAASPLGRRVCALALADPDVSGVVALDSVSPEPGVDGVDVRVVRAAEEVAAAVRGADVVVYLRDHDGDAAADAARSVADTSRLLEAAADADVGHVVLLSSAAVYGAWPNNPVPLTEDAPLRPNPGIPFVAGLAETERLAGEWRQGHPGTTVAVLRPVRTVAADARDWLARVLRPVRAAAPEVDEAPTQFVHLDDVAAAIDLARRKRLDGAYNVAPDGWIPAEVTRSLMGAGPRLSLPEPLAERLGRLRARGRRQAVARELAPFVLHPWVVANDRLQAVGWTPTTTNEAACVEAHEVGPWATLSPRRRQELALGGASVGVLAVLAGIVVAVRRALGRR